jgi:hypothetical protein
VYTDTKNLDRFRLYTHVIIDGEANIRPWNPLMKNIMLLIRMCIKRNIKLFACGIACLALYNGLATKFDNTFAIGRREIDTNINPATGDLFQNGIKIGNCGFHSNRHAL